MVNPEGDVQSSVNRRIPQFTRGDRFRKAREKLGMEQGAFAEHIGVSRGTVSNYERDASPARRVVASAWALATDVPLEWLLDADEAAEEPFLDMLRRAGDAGRANPELGAMLRDSLRAFLDDDEPTPPTGGGAPGDAIADLADRKRGRGGPGTGR